MSLKTIRRLFIISALYDFILGVIFLAGFRHVYNYFNIALPNHDGYVQFAAALVVIFGIGFWFVAHDPQRNRDIIKMGILLKLSYSGVAFYHAALGNLPGIWLPFAWLDLIFLVLFILAFKSLKR
ncbi:MAG: hypothetical protein AABZ65_03080 [Candidatus Omnitrophota bacterium]